MAVQASAEPRMITYPNGGRLVESAAELPDLTNAKELFLDFETTSFHNSTPAFNSFKGHRIAGICVTSDDTDGAWYVPLRHHHPDGTSHPGNIDLDAGLRWMRDLIGSCKDWVNHGVKFDAHFAAADGANFNGRLVDTLTAAKILDSDRLYKGGYGLKALSPAWLDDDIDQLVDAIKVYLDSVRLPRNKKAKDYGLIPPDIMSPYGCQDVITGRRLWRYIQKNMPEECMGVLETEIKLTPVLFDIEREGMRVDPGELRKQELILMTELVMLEEKLENELGFNCNPAGTNDCYEVLVNHFGLPVLAYNEKSGNPKFDKPTLKSYLAHPIVATSEKITGVVNQLLHYRKRHTLLTFFVQPYIEHEVDGVLHPDYNQAVRSGRMSCKRPNAQQLSKEAKQLIHPGEGMAFGSYDYSQIEFRLMVHYIKDVEAIQAYTDDPDTDFHLWIANVCGIPRRPAKTVNFGIGYGAGKRKVMEMLKGNMDLMGKLMDQVEQLITDGKLHESKLKDMFDVLCTRRAEEVYNIYHDRLPGIRITSRRATGAAKSRGYVRNAYGRRAHLPELAAHLAFNRLVQGCAADVMKERTVAVAPRYNQTIRDLGIKLAASVHDETLFVGPAEVMRDPWTVTTIVQILEDTAVTFRVPIRTSAGFSLNSWAEASGDDGSVEVIRV